jgi:hypothetical protein
MTTHALTTPADTPTKLRNGIMWNKADLLRKFVLWLPAMFCTVGVMSAAQAAGIHGRILGLDEQGHFFEVVAGAQIEFLDQTGNQVAQTTSGANGYYRVNLSPGVYRYRLQAEGYKAEDEGRGIALQRTSGLAVHNFSLIRGTTDPDRPVPEPPGIRIGRLEGRVFETTIKANRKGVAPARITLRKEGTRILRTVLVSEETGAQKGRYEVLLEAGQWRASVSAPGFETFVDPEPIEIIDIDISKTAQRDFELTRAEEEILPDQGIKGIVSAWSTTGKPLPLPDVQIHVISADDEDDALEPITPDKSGRFSQALAVGPAMIFAQAEGFQPAARTLTVLPHRFTEVTLKLISTEEDEKPPLDILVKVRERSPEGLKPIQEAKVLLRKRGESLQEAPRNVTDKQGDVSFEVKSAGEYTILAQCSGFRPRGTILTVVPNQVNETTILMVRESEDVEPDKLVNVAGYVAYKEPTGLIGVPGTRMSWFVGDAKSPSAISTTGSRGAFDVQLNAGIYTVDLQPPKGFRGMRAKITVEAGMKPKTFVIDRIPDDEPPVKVDVSGVVLTALQLKTRQYLSVPGATLTWLRAGTKQTTVSDKSGRFSLKLDPGSYDVSIAAKGFEPLNSKVRILPGIEPFRFVLDRKTDGLLTLRLRIVERIGTVIRTPTLRAVPQADISVSQLRRVIQQGKSDRSGIFSTRLKPGIYDIEVKHKGFRTARYRVPLTTRNVAQDIILTRAADDEPQQPRMLTLRIVERDYRQKPIKPIEPGKPVKPGSADSPRIRIDSLRDRLRQRLEQKQPQIIKPSLRFKAVPGADIVARQGKQVVTKGTSDKSGYFRVKLAPGTYQVEVRHQAFETSRQTVTISKNDVTRQIVLTRKPF